MILSDISASLSGLLCLCQHVRPTSFFFFPGSIVLFSSLVVLSLYFVCVFKAGL